MTCRQGARGPVSLLLLGLLLHAGVMAAPAADPWFLWQSAGSSQHVIGHQSWNQFLERYLHRRPSGNRLDYAAVSGGDRKLLDDYLAALQGIDPRKYNRDQQLAYWINLYNARTVALVLDHQPIDSIRDIRFGFFSFGPWDEPLLLVAGEPLSLNDIEHRIIRPLWEDPRAHYLLNCASLGCPDLWPTAIEGARVEQQLDAAARRFINQRKGVDIKRQRYSSIYHWFSKDFGGSKGVKKHLVEYAEPELAQWLARHFSELDDGYDWRLNGVP